MEKSLIWEIKDLMFLRYLQTSELPDTICFVGLDDMEMFSHVITTWFFLP